MCRFRRLRDRVGVLGLAAALAILAGLARALRAARVDESRFSPIVARGRVGSDWASRRGFDGDRVAGEVADFGVYDRDGFDPDEVHPAIRRFYERTADHALVYDTTWHRGFRTGAWLASHLTGRLEQLALPGRSDGRTRRLESRLSRVPLEADPHGARVWTRTDPDTGRAVFVALYATATYDGVTHANVAVPLPRTNLSTVLSPDHIAGTDGGTGVAFTTRGSAAGGLFLVTPLGALSLPMAQSFRVQPVDAPGAPRPLGPESAEGEPQTAASLVATHEMWLCGRQFLTVRYGIERR